MNKVSFLAVFLASIVVPVNSQQTEPARTRNQPAQSRASKDEPVRISVTLVQVDAVVTDAKGRQVTDLKPEDFEILEDGRPQRITNFSYVSAESSRPEPRQVLPSDKLAPPPPPAVLRADQVKRTIAVIVDDLGMSFESMAYARDALKKFVDQQIEAGDLVAIIRSGAGIGALQQFTTDKRQLYAAIERLRWNPMGSGGISAFQPISRDPLGRTGSPARPRQGPNSMGQRNGNAAGAMDPAAGADGQGTARSKDTAGNELDEFREQTFSVGTLGAVGYVVRGLRELPGRKSVVLVSEGFQIFNRNEPNDRVIQALRLLTDQANRASVVIYCLDPRGLQTLGLSAADDVSGFSTQEVEDRLSDRRRQLFESQDSLTYLARATGGFAVINNNDLSGGIHRVMDDQKGYYLIGYIPDDTTFKPVAGRHVFHRVAVKIKRSGLRVRSRTGFYGAEDEETRPPARTPGEQLTAALTSPFAAGDIGLKLTTLFGNSPKTSYLNSLIYIDPRDLTFTIDADGSEKAVLDVVAVTFGDNGRVVDQISRTDTVRVKEEAHKRVLDHGLLYGLVLPIKKPGAYQLRVAVRDAGSARVGSANQFVAVPDLTRGRLTVSGILLAGKDSEVKERGPNGPVGAAVEGGKIDDNVLKTGPALRLFRRGKDLDLDYTFIIYNARLDKATGRPQLESQVRLFKDSNAVYASPCTPLHLSPAHHDDWKRIGISGNMHLIHSQEPGHYVLQMVIVDKLAKEKYRAATQWTDFEVVE